jgi:Glutathione S-transferase, C-terminal domain
MKLTVLLFINTQVAGYMPFSQQGYEKAKADLAAGLAVLEKHLTHKTYLVGDELTLADISVASVLIYPFKLVCDKAYLAPYPNVLKWFQNCVAQDPFQAIIGQVTLCQKETLAPGQTQASPPPPPPPAVDNKPTPVAAATPAPAPRATDDMTDRRMVAMAIQPVAGVDPQALYTKIKTEIVSQPDYALKWDDACKIENGKIYASFTIAVEADYDEEVCDMIEMMEDQVAGQEVTFMNVFE